MNVSKQVVIVNSMALIALLMTACGGLRSEKIGNATATTAPTLTAVIPTSTPEVVYITVTPSPPPTQPPLPIFTPDAIQVERWQEYQTELIKAVLSGYDPALYNSALCEWDILGQSGEEVYVWAVCALQGGENGRRPAVIYLSGDGTVKGVKVAGYKGEYYDLELFPPDIQEKLNIYRFPPNSGGRPRQLGQHLEYRQIHLEEPPLVVLLARATTPTP